MTKKEIFKVAIIGAGAAGLMCAIEAAKKGHDVTIYDHAKNVGEKIRISGGGCCNFTNIHCKPTNFISDNKHFCKSPLARYPAESFISMVSSKKIAHHEKNPEKETGQLFCDGKAQNIIDMLLDECRTYNVKIYLESAVEKIEQQQSKFIINVHNKKIIFDKVVIATGGLSIPKMGASDFGYQIARQFGLKIIPTCPALVPLTFTDEMLNFTKNLSGVAIDSVIIRSKTNHFKDDLLFTHRGLSGPVILQISSYWDAGEPLFINFLPEIDLLDLLKQARKEQPKVKLQKFLSPFLPVRFLESFFALHFEESARNNNLADYNDKKLQTISELLQNWVVKPNGTEGYRTAEVTRGGIDTDEIDNKTFECKHVQGLYFIGELLDITGHLGGHNFQWAWASGYCCGSEM